jgi:hypothetical protein
MIWIKLNNSWQLKEEIEIKLINKYKFYFKIVNSISEWIIDGFLKTITVLKKTTENNSSSFMFIKKLTFKIYKKTYFY